MKEGFFFYKRFRQDGMSGKKLAFPLEKRLQRKDELGSVSIQGRVLAIL